MNGKAAAGLLVLVVLAIVIYSAAYTVDETQQVSFLGV